MQLAPLSFKEDRRRGPFSLQFPLTNSTWFLSCCLGLNKMASTTPISPVSGVRLSSVVPSQVTGADKDHELTNMDLALKLHYIRGVYLFKSEAVQGLTIYDLKEPMFPWLTLYFTASGRIRRRSETGRPFVKCNDGGVRIAEAYCEKTIEEWLALNENCSLDSHLVCDQVLGPDLGFSPLVFVQFTWFKCGGISVGLSWAHVLGDPFSASNFINMWALIRQGHVPPGSLYVPDPVESDFPHPTLPRKTFTLKLVDPVGDYWLTSNSCKMRTHCFHFTAKHLENILSSSSGLRRAGENSHFDVLAAVIWKSLSKIREDSGPRIVTICTSNFQDRSSTEVPRNKMVFSVVKADFSVAKGCISELAELIAEKQEEENSLIDETVESHGAKVDYLLYGTHLTFANLEEANIYGLELKGHKPVFANYTIKGVGDEGAVLVLPGPERGAEKAGVGRTVTVILPEFQLAELRNALKKDWDIV